MRSCIGGWLAVVGNVTFDIVGGNNNSGKPAFSINATTGVISTASMHDYETTPQIYFLNVSATVASTAPYYTGPLVSYTIITFHGTHDAHRLSWRAQLVGGAMRKGW